MAINVILVLTGKPCLHSVSTPNHISHDSILIACDLCAFDCSTELWEKTLVSLSILMIFDRVLGLDPYYVQDYLSVSRFF